MEKDGNCYNIVVNNYNYYKNLSDNITYCVPKNEFCPYEYPFENIMTKECKNDFTYEELMNKTIIPTNYPYVIQKVHDVLYEALKNGSIDLNTNEIIIKGKNVSFHILKNDEQDFETMNNLSSIDLNECEDLLKEKYNIKDSLIIFIADIKRNDTISTQVEYQIINPYNNEILDLSICDNVKIDIYAPIDLDTDTLNLYKNLKEQGYDLYNSSDLFYNDICSPYDSEYNTDVLLSDRKNDFYDQYITFCQENCTYNSINTETVKVDCSCQNKNKTFNTSYATFQPNILIENFFNIEKNMNLKVIYCFRLVFSYKGQKNNIGSMFLIVIIILFIIIMILHFTLGRKKILEIFEKMIVEYKELKHQISFKKSKSGEIEDNNLKDIPSPNNPPKKVDSILLSPQINRKKFRHRKSINFRNNKICNIIINNQENFSLDLKSNSHIEDSKKSINNIKPFCKVRRSRSNIVVVNINDSENKNRNRISISKNSEPKKIIKTYVKKHSKLKHLFNKKTKKEKSNDEGISKNIVELIKNIPKNERHKHLTDDELNDLEYVYACEIDIRHFCQYYWSLVKKSHLIISTFINYKDYNVFFLKLGLFFMSISLYFFMNTLFFDDSSMHKLYVDYGKYDIIYQIPKTLYSCIISKTTSFILRRLSLSQKDLIKLKKISSTTKIKQEIEKSFNCLITKFIIFFSLSFPILLFFWYFLSAFCAVYRNTQIPLVKNSCISYLWSSSYVFGIALLPGIFRYASLCGQHNKESLYKLSQLLRYIV